MKTLSERNRILNEVKDSCYLAFFDGNPEEGGKEILTGRKKVNFPVATNGYVKSTNQIDFTGGEEDVVAYGETSQQTYTGKNLLPFPYTGGGNSNGITFSVNDDRSITINGKNNGNSNSSFNLYYVNPSVKTFPAGTYYFAPPSNTNIMYVIYTGSRYYDIDSSNGYSCTFSSVTDIQMIYVQVRKGNTTTFDNVKIRPMITTISGQTEADYEIYVGGTPAPNPDYPQEVKNVTIGNLELCKIGDYQDYLYTENGKWYKHEEIKKVTLNGNESWQKGNILWYSSAFLGTNKAVGSNIISVVCSHFYPATYSDMISSPTGKVTSGNNDGFMRIGYDMTKTLDEFKNFLSSNSPDLYYVAKTSSDTEITDQTTIAALEEMFGDATGVAKFWGVYDSAVGGKLLYYYIMPYDVNIVQGSTITINAGNCVLKEG